MSPCLEVRMTENSYSYAVIFSSVKFFEFDHLMLLN